MQPQDARALEARIRARYASGERDIVALAREFALDPRAIQHIVGEVCGPDLGERRRLAERRFPQDAPAGALRRALFGDGAEL